MAGRQDEGLGQSEGEVPLRTKEGDLTRLERSEQRCSIPEALGDAEDRGGCVLCGAEVVGVQIEKERVIWAVRPSGRNLRRTRRSEWWRLMPEGPWVMFG
jgi:hypothetical protein